MMENNHRDFSSFVCVGRMLWNQVSAVRQEGRNWSISPRRIPTNHYLV